MNKRLVHEDEQTWYIVCLVTSILIYVSLIISIIGIVYIGIGLVAALVMHGLMVAGIRSSGVKLSERQFPQIYERVQALCREMGVVQVPDVYIIQSGGVLNAFATRFSGRNFVVLYSDIVELIMQGDEEELNFVIAHELAHIQRKHVSKFVLVFPAMWIPFIGKAYSRACEFTCDRIATAYTGNAEAAVHALTILAAGKQLYRKVNINEFLDQSYQERGFFVAWYELISTHPPLPKRIGEVLHFHSNPQLFGYDSHTFEARDTSGMTSQL
ncbi:M48 family metallopeptidase [Paenibacillus radicis (ex Xue et al. 2023)]|uniref:M48 family metallopeptidase n=1 Tax=Paenibacillus radicis (ex Xue et al. 2023) TaxID=2972489 RepID=A0ABT1YS74_9BACL|nr:M48 family metallopeptidase [Paenibacillus radicis (ex Xue et al. 2023)]MCR8636025.1 M48 family metallopeptidase [Paenibacillus radicis (ex Xue et al. 2023)]